MRLGLLAAGYGFIAGTVAALVLWTMQRLSGLIWPEQPSTLYIVAVIMTGGALIALLRRWYSGESLASQIADAQDPAMGRWRNTLLLAAMAVVAVAFGGAIGPEAGILAVVAEMSAVIAALIARNHAEARMIGEVGASGALGGLYGSPPGGAAIAQGPTESPKWQLLLAAVTGLLGFMMVGHHILPGGGMRIHLPAYVASGDGSDLLWSVVPAAFGAAAGLAFIVLLPRLQIQLARVGGVSAQTLVGTALFAALAAYIPILRFSGHHEMEAMLHWAHDAAPWMLLALALLKVLALTLCLGAGWRGGSAFPLLFAGAAAGAAVVSVLPGTPSTVAIIAGMTAAITVGMGKPIAAMLVALFLIGPIAPGPLCVGAMIGWAISTKAPKPMFH